MNDKRAAFMPVPREVRELEPPFPVAREGMTIGGDPRCLWIMERLAERLRGRFKVPVAVEQDASGRRMAEWEVAIWHAHDEAVQLPQAAGWKGRKEEAYTLTVLPDAIRLEAGSYRGCLYAAFALEQWMAGSAERHAIAGVRVADEPDLELRGMHLDLKGSVPTLAYMKETIERLAALRINTLLIEYEDRFPFRKQPLLVRPEGLKPQELTELLEHARRFGMSTIPVLQCLGHADYVLKHEEYAHLREQGYTSQYCPTDPGTRALFRSMVDELLEYHADSEYIHIGADETRALGACERCAERIGDGTAADLFLAYVSDAASYILSKGKRPIIWDDMFHSEKCVNRVSELPPGTVLCSWSYYEFDRPSRWVWWGGGYRASRQWLNADPGGIPAVGWLEELPAAEQEQIRSCWDEGDYPRHGGSAVPWIVHYMEQGYEVLGASCARGADSINAWYAHQGERVGNVAFWAQFAGSRGMKGVMATAWTRFYSLSPPIEPWETGWLPTAAHACWSWNNATEPERFERLWTHHYAEGDDRVLQAVKRIDEGMEAREEMYFGAKGNYFLAALELLKDCRAQSASVQRYVDMLRLTAQWETLRFRLDNGLRQMEWMSYYNGSHRQWERDCMAKRSSEQLRQALQEAEEWARQATAWCRTFMAAEEAAELVGTKLHPYRERCRRMKALDLTASM